MIIGFAPGIRSGLAVIDLRGQVLMVTEFSGGIKQATELLQSNFRPSIVASDKHIMPDVKKLATVFNSFVFYPKTDLTLKQKATMTKPFKLKSQHEKDALAAALFALKIHKKLIDKVMKREQDILEMLLKREMSSVSLAKNRKETQKEKQTKKIELNRRIEDLTRKLDISETVLLTYEKKIEELEKRKKEESIKTVVMASEDFKLEKAARKRLEKELISANRRVLKIEAEFKKLKKAKPEQKEDIQRETLRLIEEYKKRFHS